MKLLAFILAALLLSSGVGMAFTVKPAYLAIQDTGNDNLPALDVGIAIDCDTKEIEVDVASNETGDAVGDAMAYLFYTDYSYQALPNPGKTDSAGKTTIPVPGTLRFLKAMFTLRVDKQGFQSREIEFTYAKCFEAQPEPPEPPANDTGTGQTNQTPPANTTPVQNATPPSNATSPANTTPQVKPDANGTGTPQPDGQGTGASACPAAAGLALLTLLIAKPRG